MTILERILVAKRREVAALRARVSEDELMARVADAPPPRDFAGALRGHRPRVIAEVKRASPSAGAIRAGADAAAIAAEYEAAGAAAVSVLTDEEFFSGALADLTAARARVAIPVLRKDFIIDRHQVLEARAAGADAILLIVAALELGALSDLLAAAHEQKMGVLVEIHDEEEAARAFAAGAQIIGVNSRNLKTFEMDCGLFARLRPSFPAGTIAVAESGIRTVEDVRALAAAGADAVLVGETLMRRPSPGEALRELLA